MNDGVPYCVLDISKSGSHYFSYTVVDKRRPLFIAGILCEGEYEIACETADEDIANRICSLLNEQEKNRA